MESRKQKIESLMGKWYGCKYRLAYWLHKKTYIKWIGKREITLKLWKKYKMKVRLFSRDLDFFENIYVGKLKDSEFAGEYDIDIDNSLDGILDLGANMGLFSFMYAVKYPDKKIIALEPESENFKLLCKNMEQFDNVICIKAGVWYRDASVKVYPSRVKVYPSETYSEGAFYIGECEKTDVEASAGYSIETLVEQYQLKKYMVKMDIEGAEYEIFKLGDLKWLDNCHLFVIETHEWILPETHMDELIETTLKNRGFSKTELGENKIFSK